MLWAWTAFILLPESLLSKTERKARAQFLIPVVMAISIFSGTIWALIFGNVNPGLEFTAMGASGLVYAVWGGSFGFSLMNIINALSTRSAAVTKKKVKRIVFSNIVYVALVLAILVYSPDLFLSKAPGSNIFVHGIAFLLGFGLVAGREYILPLRGALKMDQK